jgi:hypothetical protein
MINMAYTPLTASQAGRLNKETPLFWRYKIGTWIRGLAAAVATLTGAETLTNKTLTAPVVNTPAITGGTIAGAVISSPDIYVVISSHDYAAGAADWELSAAEAKSSIITATNANDACAIVATPDSGKVYWIKNGTGQALTIKAAEQTGVTIANGKTAAVYGNATDFVRLTADA